MTTRHFTRREALKLGALGAGVLLLPSALRSATARAAVAHASPRKKPFEADLPIPPILQPVRRDATAATSSSFLRRLATCTSTTWSS